MSESSRRGLRWRISGLKRGRGRGRKEVRKFVAGRSERGPARILPGIAFGNSDGTCVGIARDFERARGPERGRRASHFEAFPFPNTKSGIGACDLTGEEWPLLVPKAVIRPRANTSEWRTGCSYVGPCVGLD